ncbi:hypothetical protein LUZ62_037012 [Rhynchospora pubera]|uniref:non-specific serine/threonine protein kinase n=1 Tax=Rhynchospora pubera TaxID=906938 RepID=A0AAV8F222_9POAL|nr:hypothetical protein LUZ62_037012 [Rhynchospora pubera]
MTPEEILPFNPGIKDKNYLKDGDRVNVNFSCDCIDNSFLGHTFQYTMQRGDYYKRVSQMYASLTSTYFLAKFNWYSPDSVPTRATINVTVNCSCGDQSISNQYGLFVTYPLQADENSRSVASAFNLSAAVVDEYNRGTNFSSEGGILYVPTHDQNGSYRPLYSKRSKPGRVITGIVIGIIAILLSIGFFSYYLFKRRKANKLCLRSEESSFPLGESTTMDWSVANAPPVAGLTIDKSVEFSYQELSQATSGFSTASKIGQGGFGSVFYAELRGEKAAIKKMGIQASREFLAELKVLSHVHHLNLVKLIGYCIEGGLFLIYEYIENGNLSQHLHSSAQSHLSWGNRVQIALDSARGLEYIHEHTVADFGLTKLKEVESMNLSSKVAGTLGYMPPEYFIYGDVSPKVDVYAFGVVMYELISAKKAIIMPSSDSSSETMGLVRLFHDALSNANPKESLKELIDPRLGDEYPIDSILKMAQLAKECTRHEPRRRPFMKSMVVALMTLSSDSESWDIGNNPP